MAQKPDYDEKQVDVEMRTGAGPSKDEGTFLRQTKASKGLLARSPARADEALPGEFTSRKEIELNVERGKAWKDDADTRAMEDTPDDALGEFAALGEFSVRSSLIEGGMGMKGGAAVTIPKEGGPDEQRGKAGGEG